MPRISDKRKAEVRNQLIDAAVHVLLTEGPAAATSRRILDRAGLSAGALYHYFSSLDELFAGVAERFSQYDDPYFEKVAEASDDQAEVLAEVHGAVMADMFGPGDHTILGQLRVAAKANTGLRTALVHFDELTVERFGALNRTSQEVGLFRDDMDAETLVEVIGTFLEGLSTKDDSTGFVTDRARVLRLFLEMVSDRVVDPDSPSGPTFRRIIEEITTP